MVYCTLANVVVGCLARRSIASAGVCTSWPLPLITQEAYYWQSVVPLVPFCHYEASPRCNMENCHGPMRRT